MRTKVINLVGKDYWIAFSAQSQMNMEALKRTPGFDMKTHTVEFGFATLYEVLRAGYRWAQLNGRQANEPPSREDLADMIGNDDIMALMKDINEVALGERNVVAKPPKKEQAGESGD